jgi:hypothetical protein
MNLKSSHQSKIPKVFPGLSEIVIETKSRLVPLVMQQIENLLKLKAFSAALIGSSHYQPLHIAELEP